MMILSIKIHHRQNPATETSNENPSFETQGFRPLTRQELDQMNDEQLNAYIHEFDNQLRTIEQTAISAFDSITEDGASESSEPQIKPTSRESFDRSVTAINIFFSSKSELDQTQKIIAEKSIHNALKYMVNHELDPDERERIAVRIASLKRRLGLA